MPVNDKQLDAAFKWFFPSSDFRTRIDYLWDGLTAPQQSALIARIKTDLNSDLDDKEAKLDAERDDLLGI